MDSSAHQALEKLRSDRRKLLEFLLSSGIVKKITALEGSKSSLSRIDYDSLSTNYVLECIQTGGVLDLSQATKRYYEEFSQPIVFPSRSGDVFYLNSDSESSGSPPLRVPPTIPVIKSDPVPILNNSASAKLSSVPSQENGTSSRATTSSDYRTKHWEKYPPLGLPNLRTGLKDDDLRQVAYEVFLACVVFSGVETQPSEGRKKEKSPKLLVGLKNRKVKHQNESESPEPHLKVLDTIRVQMQISEATDALIRRRLTQFSSVNSFGQIDVPQLSLMLLTGILRSDFTSPKLYLHWKNRQVKTFEELICSNHGKMETQSLVPLLAKIRNLEEWDIKMSPPERDDVLLKLRQVALEFSSMPARFGVEGETYYWSCGYHLNIKLYEKLLFCLFDILEENQLIEEVEEVLKLVKLTWPVLGITEKLHSALFSWVLFQQFVATKETLLLDNAICEVEKVLSTEIHDESEVAYLKTLICFSTVDGREIRSNLLHSILMSISSWCDYQLQDYHLHFSQKLPLFERVLKLGLLSAVKDLVPHGHRELTGSTISHETVVEKIEFYVEKTFNATCSRVSCDISVTAPDKDRVLSLDLLAKELRSIAEEDYSLFCPIISIWYPECVKISAKMLHRFYGERLKLFLKDVTSFTEDAQKVLPAAYALERCLIEHYYSACKEDNPHYGQEFDPYPIADHSRSIILDWVVAQNERILEWTGRTFDLEEWEPLSSQQKHAVSAVEVFRIIEETVDRFFEWSLPMDITHLQALLSVIFHSLDAYLSKVISQLVDKQNFYPPVPTLTRYKEATFPIVKRKVVESLIVEDQLYSQLDDLTTSKICIRLNTFRYIQRQTGVLEDGIRKSWISLVSYQTNRYSGEEGLDTSDTTDSIGELVTELFVATLDCIKGSAAQAIRKTSDFLGAKIVFWDMRDSFLDSLYRGSVEGHRIEGVLPEFDSVLNKICGLVDDSIRDLVVSSVWKASQEGFMRVLLDGGPLRAFSDEDIKLIEEDFNMLKDMFVADGEGLPRSLVEGDAKFYQQILSLFSLQTESLIHMLMESSEHISISNNNTFKNGQHYLGDAHTLIRILCHKKDREASKFLKRQYQLPPSSDYDETRAESPSLSSPLVADILKRTASIRWSEKGQSSFRSFKQKLQDATWR